MAIWSIHVERPRAGQANWLSKSPLSLSGRCTSCGIWLYSIFRKTSPERSSVTTTLSVLCTLSNANDSATVLGERAAAAGGSTVGAVLGKACGAVITASSRCAGAVASSDRCDIGGSFSAFTPELSAHRRVRLVTCRSSPQLMTEMSFGGFFEIELIHSK